MKGKEKVEKRKHSFLLTLSFPVVKVPTVWCPVLKGSDFLVVVSLKVDQLQTKVNKLKSKLRC